MTTLLSTALQQIPVADPAVDIGRRLAQALDQDTKLQEAEFNASRAKRSSHAVFKEAVAHEYDRTLALRALLTTVKATTLEGAVIQIAEAIAVADLIRDGYPEKAEGYEVKQKFRELYRLLFSALAAADASAKTPLAAVHPSHFGVKHCDPWVDAFENAKRRDDAAAEVQARAAARKGGAA